MTERTKRDEWYEFMNKANRAIEETIAETSKVFEIKLDITPVMFSLTLMTYAIHDISPMPAIISTVMECKTMSPEFLAKQANEMEELVKGFMKESSRNMKDVKLSHNMQDVHEVALMAITIWIADEGRKQFSRAISQAILGLHLRNEEG